MTKMVKVSLLLLIVVLTISSSDNPDNNYREKELVFSKESQKQVDEVNVDEIAQWLEARGIVQGNPLIIYEKKEEPKKNPINMTSFNDTLHKKYEEKVIKCQKRKASAGDNPQSNNPKDIFSAPVSCLFTPSQSSKNDSLKDASIVLIVPQEKSEELFQNEFSNKLFSVLTNKVDQLKHRSLPPKKNDEFRAVLAMEERQRKSSFYKEATNKKPQINRVFQGFKIHLRELKEN